MQKRSLATITVSPVRRTKRSFWNSCWKPISVAVFVTCPHQRPPMRHSRPSRHRRQTEWSVTNKYLTFAAKRQQEKTCISIESFKFLFMTTFNKQSTHTIHSQNERLIPFLPLGHCWAFSRSMDRRYGLFYASIIIHTQCAQYNNVAATMQGLPFVSN